MEDCGQVEAVQSQICSPNTGRSPGVLEALPIEIGSPLRAAAPGRLGEVTSGRFGEFKFEEPGFG